MNYALLRAFGQAFRTPDLRKKMLFVLFIVLLFRLGSAIPAPGVSEKNIHSCLVQVTGGNNANVYTLINLFSGGALLKLSILALGIMPYITSSIIIQLLVVVIPRLERLKQEGQSGQAKLTQYTRYLTIGLAILAVVGVRRACAHAWPDLHRLYDADHPQRRLAGDPDHRADDDGGHRDHHVARRAHHRPRHRQRHVDPDLHPDRRPLPVRAQQHPADQGPVHLLDGDRGRCRHHRGDRVRRAGATTHPGAVRETHDRPPHVRRHVDVPAVEGQPGRCHPGHLRVVPALHPVAVDQGLDRATSASPSSSRTTCRRTGTSPTCCCTPP